MGRSRLGWIAVLALATAVARAEPDVLDLPAYLAIVERHSPELAAAREQRAFALGDAQVAQAYPNPELALGGGPWRSRVGAASGTSRGIEISQPIELPSVRSARIAAAAAGLDSASAGAAAVRLAVGYQARQAIYDFIRRRDDTRLARESLELLEQIQGRVLKRVEVGESPRFELVRAEAETLAARNAFAASRLRLEEARGGLRRLAGGALPPEFDIRGTMPQPPQLPALPELRAAVLADNPTLRAVEAERERAQRRVEQERALRAPQPAVRIGESRDPETRSATVGLTLSIPIWNRREGQIAQALATVGVADALARQQRAQLLRELESAHARLGIAQSQIATFEAGLLRSAEAALQVAEAAYRFGERSFLEVLDAQRTLRVVRGDYNQARYESIAAWLDIERLRAQDPFQTEKP